MLRHVLRRLLIASVTLVLITFVVYGLLRSIPGDPASTQVGGDPGTPVNREFLDAMRKDMGLDRHWTVGYLGWIADVVRLDLGKSLIDRRPVVEAIAPRIGPTLLLSVTSILLAYILSIPLGLWCGARSGTNAERALSAFLYMLYSLPSFVAALFLLIFFSVNLDWLPLGGMRSRGEGFEALSLPAKAWDVFLHMLLPVTCFTYGSLAYYVRFIRANLQEALRQDYIRTARAKGLGEFDVVAKHAFRNSLIPLVTLLGMTLPALLGGSVILERIFDWPGMGSFLFDSLLRYDYPMIMGIVLLFSVLVLLGNLLADLLYALVDPRIRTA